MAHRNACSTRRVGGRPRRYQDGRGTANSRIYLSKETLSQWRRLRTAQDLSSDNDVTVFLLERNQVLTEIHASQQITASHRLENSPIQLSPVASQAPRWTSTPSQRDCSTLHNYDNEEETSYD